MRMVIRACAVVLAVLLLGVGIAGVSAQGPVEISFYYPVAVGGPITRIVDGYAADFTKENPAIRVKPIYTGTYQETIVKALTAMKSGEPPQTAIILSTDMFTLIDEDAIVPIDDFVKVDMRVGVVLSAERVKGADKLLHLKVDIGEPEPRTIVAGIAEAYDPAALPGRKVVIVANLQPRKLRGLTSQGMIVAASLEGGKPVLAGFLEDVPVGARLK